MLDIDANKFVCYLNYPPKIFHIIFIYHPKAHFNKIYSSNLSKYNCFAKKHEDNCV